MIYTQGVLDDGAVILKEGEIMSIDEIAKELNDYRRIVRQASMAMFNGSNAEKMEVINYIADMLYL